jgi:eukaryotic-like serine/threonine-protein kinase
VTGLGAGSTLSEGRYRLEEVVGRGGMAIVWRASDLQLERDVAIKVISDVLASDPPFVTRFEREARVAAALNHPNLVKVFDFSIEEKPPYLVMEYIGGGTLADPGGRELDPGRLARDLLDALAHIHAAGILHRDIKPANVLLTAEGSPRLTDFGIARAEDQTGLTQTGQVMGTLRYIAPEVAAGKPASAASDLYSLGVLLGEIADERPGAALTDLIVRMTATDPAARPASAAEALAELEPTRPLPRSDATQPDLKTVPGPVFRERFTAWQLAGAGAVLLVILALVIAAATGGDDPGPAAQPARPAAPDAPVEVQLQRLEQIVTSAAAR